MNKPFAWSWSALESYETCPKKHWHTKIKKDYVEEAGEAATWGKQVHAAMADRISKGKRLPNAMPYDKHIDDVMQNSDRTQVITRVEQQLAVTEDMQPCKYFDKQVDPWCRVVADVLKLRIQDGVARLVDWKTGKGKFYPDPVSGENVADSDQLRLAAAVMFAHWPEINMVWTQFYWLQEDVVTNEIVWKADLSKFWSRLLPRVDKMQEAWRTTEYPPKPSGLCKRHCPVTSCPHHGIGSF